MSPRLLVEHWDQASIDAECAGIYGRYTRARTEGYRAYLAREEHPYEKSR
jgi:hypothetical protein